MVCCNTYLLKHTVHACPRQAFCLQQFAHKMMLQIASSSWPSVPNFWPEYVGWLAANSPAEPAN
jgi:hypothetical protein